jgi:uridylate kinase
MENNLPIRVLNFWEEGALRKSLLGEPVGTLINSGD